MSESRGFVLCGTALRPGQLAEVKRLVIQLGGATYDGRLTMATTHLLVEGPVNQGEKYPTAVSGAAGSIILVDSKWVFASAAEGAWLPESDFAVPPLRGLVVASTGLNETARLAAQEAVEKGGGTFQDLSRETTHLLALEARGDEYGRAVQYGKVVVHPRWVHASLSAGHCLPTDNFPLDDADERARELEALGAAAAAASELSADFFANGGWRTIAARNDLPASDGLAGCVVALLCGSAVDDNPALLQAAMALRKSMAARTTDPLDPACTHVVLVDYDCSCTSSSSSSSSSSTNDASDSSRKTRGMSSSSSSSSDSSSGTPTAAAATPHVVPVAGKRPVLEAARKSGKWVVGGAWLLDCTRNGTQCAEKPYVCNLRKDATNGRAIASAAANAEDEPDHAASYSNHSSRSGVNNISTSSSNSSSSSSSSSSVRERSATGLAAHRTKTSLQSNSKTTEDAPVNDTEVATTSLTRKDASSSPPTTSLERSDSRSSSRSRSQRGADAPTNSNSAAEGAKEDSTAPAAAAAAAAAANVSSAPVAAGSNEVIPPSRPQIFARLQFVFLGSGGGSAARRAEFMSSIKARGGTVVAPEDALAAITAAHARAQPLEPSVSSSSSLTPPLMGPPPSSLTTSLSRSRVPPIVLLCESGPEAREITDSLLLNLLLPSSMGAQRAGELEARNKSEDSSQELQPSSSSSSSNDVPPLNSNRVHPFAATAATYLWLCACLRDGALFPIHSFPELFEPQPWPICTNTLKRFSGSILNAPSSASSSSPASKAAAITNGCVVALSQFVNAERAGLIELIKVLGAKYTTNFSRLNSHLVIKVPQGEKYERAQKEGIAWGVATVTSNWLLHCAQHGWQPGCEQNFALQAKATKDLPDPKLAQLPLPTHDRSSALDRTAAGAATASTLKGSLAVSSPSKTNTQKGTVGTTSASAGTSFTLPVPSPHHQKQEQLNEANTDNSASDSQKAGGTAGPAFTTAPTDPAFKEEFSEYGGGVEEWLDGGDDGTFDVSGFGTRKRGNGGGNGFARAPPKQKARLAPRRHERPESNPADLGDHDGDGNGPSLYCESQVVTYN